MKIDTNFKLEAIPERVYAVLKLIEFHSYKKEDLKNLIHPINASSDKELNIVLNYLLECEWVVQNSEGYFELNFDIDNLESIEHFRKKINSILFSGDRTIFYIFTNWVLQQNEAILDTKVSQYTKVNPDLVLGNTTFHLQWRLWATFLGFGNLHNSIFIPNPLIRIKDIIQYYKNELDFEKDYTLNEFFIWLLNKCPELNGCIVNNKIAPFLTLALRNLHDQGTIKLNYHQDYPEIWYLENSDFHEIGNRITHIRLRGDSNE